MGIHLKIFKFRVMFSCTDDHFMREVNANYVRRLQLCKQIAHAAADLKYALMWGNEKFIDFDQPAMIPFSHAAPMITFFSDRIPMCFAVLIISFHNTL